MGLDSTPPASPHQEGNADGIAGREQVLVRAAVDELFRDAPGVPLFPTLEGFNGPTVSVSGRTIVNFAGYNYLGLSSHPEVLAAAHDAIDRYGTSAGGSRLVSGQNPIHLELERALAGLAGTEAALVFVSGHATNETVIGHLLGPKDLVLVDELSHNSILQGVRLSGARMVPFPHNSARRCERLLTRSRSRFDRAMVIVEGLYSMDGDVPDLEGFCGLRDRFDVSLMVDEAHSFGVLGEGRGIAAEQGIDRARVDVTMGTLSKSLASCGGFIGGSEELIEYLRYTTPGFVFSVAPPPAVAAAALAAARIIAAGRAPVGQLRQNCERFHAAASERGVALLGSPVAPIATVPIGSREACASTAEALFEDGLLVQPVMYPAVARGQERLRFFITAAHTDAHIDRALDLLAAVLARRAPSPV